MTSPRPLRVGDRVRHLAGGPVWVVAMTSAGSQLIEEVIVDRVDWWSSEHRMAKIPASSLRRTWIDRMIRP